MHRASLKRMEKLDRDQSTRRNTFQPQLPAGQRAQRYRRKRGIHASEEEKAQRSPVAPVERNFLSLQGFPQLEK